MRNLSIEERKHLLSEINQCLLTGELTLGQTVRKIRTQLYTMSQANIQRLLDYLRRLFEI